MAETVDVKPELIRWAIERSELPFDELEAKFPKLGEWQSGARQPTFKQLEDFANRTMTRFGYLFLDTPPVEALDIPDFRTKDNGSPKRPSPNLIDTLHDMQRRQNWMRDFLIEQGQEALPFVGDLKGATQVKALAKRVRDTLGLEDNWAEQCANWEAALMRLRTAIESIGIWVGKDGLFDLVNTLPANDETEKFCNQVAAEFLVPAEKVGAMWQDAKAAGEPFRQLSRWFKVSPVVVARRALDLSLVSKAQFFAFYRRDQEEGEQRKAAAKAKENKGGPDFYVVQDVRLGRRFAQAVVLAVREGRLLYRDAYRLTNLKGDTFNEYANRLSHATKG